MTEKRFGMIKSEISDLYVIVDEQKEYSFGGIEDEYGCMRIVNVLNSLYDMRIENGKIASAYLKENEQLKEENRALKDTVEALQSELAHCEEDYIMEEYL